MPAKTGMPRGQIGRLVLVGVVWALLASCSSSGDAGAGQRPPQRPHPRRRRLLASTPTPSLC
jgi:hypothetical protein